MVFDALIRREVGASVRTMSPQSGSSVSIRSKMYSMLRGFVDLAVVAGGDANSQDDDCDGVGSSLLCLTASLQRSVISAMKSVRCLLLADLRPANISHYPTSSGDEKKHGRRGKSASFCLI